MKQEPLVPSRELLLSFNRELTGSYELSGEVNLPSLFGKVPLGDGGDKSFTSAATAVWLTRNAAALFTVIWEKYLQGPLAQAPSPAELSAKLLQTMQAELRYLPSPQQAALLAHLMASIAGSGDPHPVRWSDELKELADLHAAYPSGLGIETPLVRWMVDTELNGEESSLARRSRSLEGLLREHPKKAKYWDLNNWAYLLLNLDLVKAATPLARAALEEKRWSGTLDTYGWAMFHEGDYGEAEAHLLAAERLAGKGTEEWSEIQFHRIHVSFWGGELQKANAILKDLAASAADSVWRLKASRLLATPDAGPPQGRRARKYDVALSFAGEDRAYASALAAFLKAREQRVFYDDYLRAELWGENLYEYLIDIYQHQAILCVIFISQHYVQNSWSRLECRAAQVRAMRENQPYILPVRLDQSELPGLLPTIAYIDLESSSIEEIGNLLMRKLAAQVN